MFSRDYGKIALVDKGGRRFKSKRGRLVPFAHLEITFYKSERSSTGYISETELIELFSFEKEGTMGRLAYASAACELLHYLLSDEQPQPSLYNFFLTFLQMVEVAEKTSLPPLFITFFLQLLSQLGYHPSLTGCVGCGRVADTHEDQTEEILFSPERGGIICSACQTVGDYYIPFSYEDSRYLLKLQNASLNEAAGVPIGYSKATRLLDALVKFVSYQTGAISELKSLEFLEKLKNGYPANGRGNK